jgi:hypothetical protein
MKGQTIGQVESQHSQLNRNQLPERDVEQEKDARQLVIAHKAQVRKMEEEKAEEAKKKREADEWNTTRGRRVYPVSEERKAKQIATQIVMRTSGTMKLEDQENSEERIEKAIEERTAEIIDEMPKILWD